MRHNKVPVCDATTNKGRLLTDSVDGVLKHCNGEWQPLTPHIHWQFRESTAVLTAPQSTFNILDPTIVPGSLEVHPLPGFGAIEIGTHRFLHPREPGNVGQPRFLHIWQNRDGAWKLSRVISYDH